MITSSMRDTLSGLSLAGGGVLFSGMAVAEGRPNVVVSDPENRGLGPSDKMEGNLTTHLGVKLAGVGYWHTCAWLDNNATKCWGWNGSGQPGLGETSARGDGASQLEHDLPAVDLGSVP